MTGTQPAVSSLEGALLTERHILVVAHTGRQDSLDAAVEVCRRLIDAGLTPVLSRDDLDDILAVAPERMSSKD